jgi:tripartite-type tricarboxylate transporter receptor subunit TctC
MSTSEGNLMFANVAAGVLALGMVIGGPGIAAAQPAYPSKPIRMIVPNPPGGGVDMMGRIVGQRLSGNWGQQVIVDNRPGGHGFIGGQAVAKAAPDGYTLMAMSSTHIITPLLYPAPYDPIRDFAAVATTARSRLILAVHPSLPVRSLGEFIALAKTRPGELNYGSSGAGSTTHLAGAYFGMLTGTRLQNISYKGSGQVMNDLAGGHIQLAFAVSSPTIPHVLSGKLRAIAVSGDARLRALPQVPTFTQAGLPGFDIGGWFGVIAPAGTPKAIVDKLSNEITKVLALPDVSENIIAQGADPFPSTPERFEALMKVDTATFARIIKSANIKADE